VTGAKHVFMMLSLFSKDGTPKLVRHCTYPPTGLGYVSRVYTDYATFLISDNGIRLRETYRLTVDELADRRSVDLLRDDDQSEET